MSPRHNIAPRRPPRCRCPYILSNWAARPRAPIVPPTLAVNQADLLLTPPRRPERARTESGPCPRAEPNRSVLESGSEGLRRTSLVPVWVDRYQHDFGTGKRRGLLTPVARPVSFRTSSGRVFSSVELRPARTCSCGFTPSRTTPAILILTLHLPRFPTSTGCYDFLPVPSRSTPWVSFLLHSDTPSSSSRSNSLPTVQPPCALHAYHPAFFNSCR